jgi:prevent-host-death family protein
MDMIDFSDVQSLADFQRNAKQHVRRLKRTGRPQVLTVDGREALVVQDAASYRQLIEELDQSQAVAGIRRGLRSMRRGSGRPMRDALQELARKHDIRLPRSK